MLVEVWAQGEKGVLQRTVSAGEVYALRCSRGFGLLRLFGGRGGQGKLQPGEETTICAWQSSYQLRYYSRYDY